ncbi:MAG: PEP-CTERM system histidine kinase PrsK [Deltaproteobacteria bacterium]|nr:PEP-CTERM system histidine kinase PrsK [Deltaproteobacteria bacterium]
MHLLNFLPFLCALFCLGIALFALFRDKHSFTHWIFAAGMIVLSLEMGLIGMSFRSDSLAEMIRWQEFRMITTAFLPGIWLIFSFTFARANYGEFIKKWWWVIASSFLLSVLLTIVLKKGVFIEELSFLETSTWSLRLGRSGYLSEVVFLLISVIILMNLERAFRTSVGTIRWKIKFILLGVGGFFTFRIYATSQALLFSSTGYSLQLFNAGTGFIIGILMLIGLMRMRLLKTDLYFSQTFLYNSVVILIVGVYLLSIGFLSKILGQLDISHHLPIEALFILLALTGLTIALISGEVRLKIRRFVVRHFKKPQYDYREKWGEFIERTSSSIDIHDYCDKVTKWTSGIFSVSSVTVWLLNESKERLIFGGSTALSQEEAGKISGNQESVQKWIAFLKDQKDPFDFEAIQKTNPHDTDWLNQSFLTEGRIRYGTSLMTGEHLLGFLTVNNRMKKEPFSVEDLMLLKMVASQTAGNLLNFKLAEDLRKAKEMEAFQTMSAFVVHDLKNLASTLSLTMQNLPVHFDNPEFRKDATQMIGQSVEKVNHMCSHLSLLSQKVQLNIVETDLNELIIRSLHCLNGSSKISLIQDLQPTPKLLIDPDQFQKVLTNLILNANESVGNRGEVRVATGHRDGWVTLSVSDNGCGMSEEFMEQSLFRPFKTTKKNGMGIGLYQSKMIIEAHRGRIEVESEVGKGSTFRVFLPLAGKLC